MMLWFTCARGRISNKAETQPLTLTPTPTPTRTETGRKRGYAGPALSEKFADTSERGQPPGSADHSYAIIKTSPKDPCYQIVRPTVTTWLRQSLILGNLSYITWKPILSRTALQSEKIIQGLNHTWVQLVSTGVAKWWYGGVSCVFLSLFSRPRLLSEEWSVPLFRSCFFFFFVVDVVEGIRYYFARVIKAKARSRRGREWGRHLTHDKCKACPETTKDNPSVVRAVNESDANTNTNQRRAGCEPHKSIFSGSKGKKSGENHAK